MIWSYDIQVDESSSTILPEHRVSHQPGRDDEEMVVVEYK
jgi:hypothetical protein